MLALAVCAVRLLRALAPALTLFIGKLIIDELVHQVSIPRPGPTVADWVGSGRLTVLAGWVALELLLVTAGATLARISSLIERLLGDLHGREAGAGLVRHAATLDLSFMESAKGQDSLMRARTQTVLGSVVIGNILSIAQGTVTVVSLVVALGAYSYVLAAIAIVASVPTFVNELYFGERAYKASVDTTSDRRETEYFRNIGSSPEFAKEVRLLGIGDFIAGRFRAAATRIYLRNAGVQRSRAVYGSLIGIIGSVVIYSGHAVVFWRALTGEIGLGDVTFLVGSLVRLGAATEGAVVGFTQMASQAQNIGDLYAVLDTRPAVSPGRGRALAGSIDGDIVFEDVGFRYPGRPAWAVRNLSFTIPAGKSLAIAGENGAGKTTIAKLLMRLYEPEEGRILIGGVDLKDLEVASFRDRLGAVFQDFGRYNMTAQENIGIGRFSEIGDRGKALDAAGKASIADFIAGLPMGLDQMLGLSFTRGTELSGGEWQRIAIARAYFRDPDVLVLDEPTAALDARAEAEIYDRFRDMTVNKTALLISHRLSAIRRADVIVVIERGTVIETGSHEHLMSIDGKYAELFSLQARDYQF